MADVEDWRASGDLTGFVGAQFLALNWQVKAGVASPHQQMFRNLPFALMADRLVFSISSMSCLEIASDQSRIIMALCASGKTKCRCASRVTRLLLGLLITRMRTKGMRQKGSQLRPETPGYCCRLCVLR